jgi:LRV protein FeS4 cluster/Leucine rich repeat variant
MMSLDVHAHADGGDIAPMDWQDQPLTCAGCIYQGMADEGKCQLGRACVQDRYARRIDRFLNWNPHLANELLAHPYFEVRAIAVRYADVFHLPALIDDPDETVRLQLALRLPQRTLINLREDVHREVRIRVAYRLDAPTLPSMQHDADYYVRQIVARRLPVALLASMMSDPQSDVRAEVAQRIEMPALLRMADDKAVQVRRIVAQRLPVGLLGKLAHDPELMVRWEVAQRANPTLLTVLLKDLDDDIRAVARQRLMPEDTAAFTGEHHG